MNSGLSILVLICLFVLVFGGPTHSAAGGISLVIVMCTAGVLDVLNKILEAISPATETAGSEPVRRAGFFARFRARTKADPDSDLATDLAESKSRTRAAELAARSPSVLSTSPQVQAALSVDLAEARSRTRAAAMAPADRQAELAAALRATRTTNRAAELPARSPSVPPPPLPKAAQPKAVTTAVASTATRAPVQPTGRGGAVELDVEEVLRTAAAGTGGLDGRRPRKGGG